jgi:Zn-dependent protease with chaperone function
MREGYPVQFSDGRSAARINGRMMLAANRLEVLGPDDRLLAAWRYCDLRYQDAARPGEPLRLANATQPDARLTVLHPAAIDDLQVRLKAITGSGHGVWRSIGWAVAMGLGGLAVLGGLYVGLPLAARPIARAIPVAWEEQLGDNMAGSMVANKTRCAGPDGARALDELKDRLLVANHISRRFTLHVVQDKTVNAYALPGGHIVLLSGLLADARTPDEVAGVLAHEMGHVIERHSSEQMVRSAGLGVLLTWLTGDPSGLVASVGGMLATLSYSRDAESEADARAVDLLEGAGMSTEGLSSFFLRLAEHYGADDLVPNLLSTHPRPGDRAAAHPGHAGGRPLGEAQWQAVKEMCR